MKSKYPFTILTLVIILIFWYILSFYQIINPLFLSSPQAVFTALIELLVAGEIIHDAIATIFRTFIGFIFGVLIGVPLGIFMGYYRKIYNSMEFIVDFFRSIPATALFPLFLLFFGIGDEAKIAIVVFASSLIILVNTTYGVRHRSKIRTMAAKAMGIKRFQLFRKIILPESMPHIFAGLRVAISISLIIVIVTEMFIGTNVGLGYRIINAQLLYRVPEVYASIILAGIIGYLLNHFVLFIEFKKIHWSGK